jgi:hypothetical protein
MLVTVLAHSHIINIYFFLIFKFKQSGSFLNGRYKIILVKYILKDKVRGHLFIKGLNNEKDDKSLTDFIRSCRNMVKIVHSVGMPKLHST